MITNKKIEKLIIDYISDEISDTDRKELFELAKKNKEIADWINLNDQLADPDIKLNLAKDEELREMRLNTLHKINISKRQKSRIIDILNFDNLRYLFYRPAFIISFATIMFLLGFTLNYTTSMPDNFTQEIQLAALESQDLKQSSNSPYVFSNAKMRNTGKNRVQVSFDVSRHIKIERPKDDPLIKDILAQSLLNSENTSLRLQNISETESYMDPKIKQALILTMNNDNNMIVRQKSMFSLLRYPNDKEIQKALLSVLRNEESVYMKLAAIDYLSNNKVNIQSLGDELNSLDPGRNSAVEQKIKHLKYELN